MALLTHIRVLSDGRPGHENQAMGLAEAVARRTGARVELVRFPVEAGVWARCRLAVAGDARPELVLGAGHGTHWPLWRAARRLAARSVVIMRPSLPRVFFDLVLAPRHDFGGKLPAPGGRVEVTIGALNRVPEAPAAKQARGLVLLGGPSRHHGWDEAGVLAGVRAVLAVGAALSWTIGDSRRTPAGALAALRAAGVQAEFVPHQETTPAWLPAQLATAEEVWVTADSVSMLHEAVTAGARTGVLPAPARRPGSRVAHAVETLVDEGYARTLAEWTAGNRKWPPQRALHETARCADLVLARFFSD
jgi:uncharacterized protein